MVSIPRIQKPAYRRECRQTALHLTFMRRYPAKDPISVRQLHPAIRQILVVENVQRFEDTHGIGDPAKPVLVKNPVAPPS